MSQMNQFPSSFDNDSLNRYLSFINDYDPRRRADDPSEGFTGTHGAMGPTPEELYIEQQMPTDAYGDIDWLYQDELENRLPTDAIRQRLNEELDSRGGDVEFQGPRGEFGDETRQYVESIQDQAAEAAANRRANAQETLGEFQARPIETDAAWIRAAGLSAMDAPERNAQIQMDRETYSPENIEWMASQGWEPNLLPTSRGYSGWRRRPGGPVNPVSEETRNRVEQMMAAIREEYETSGGREREEERRRASVDRYQRGLEYFDVDSSDSLIRSWSEQYLIADDEERDRLRSTHPSLSLENNRSYRSQTRKLEQANGVLESVGEIKEEDRTRQQQRAFDQATRDKDFAERAIEHFRNKAQSKLSSGLKRAYPHLLSLEELQAEADDAAIASVTAAATVDPPPSTQPAPPPSAPQTAPPAPAPPAQPTPPGPTVGPVAPPQEPPPQPQPQPQPQEPQVSQEPPEPQETDRETPRFENRYDRYRERVGGNQSRPRRLLGFPLPSQEDEPLFDNQYITGTPDLRTPGSL